jgi:pimeloyl-ACP methyl ester carboxylesterase
MTDIASEDGFVQVRGLRLHLRSWNAAAPGTPALLLHGWLDHCGSFELLAPLLAAQGPCHALDLRGHGQSDWVGAGGFYHVVEHVADLEGVLDSLRIEGPARLVGHSLGGAVALLYAAARPQRVQHATVIDALPITVAPDEVPGRLQSFLHDFKAPRARRLVASVEDAERRLLRFNPTLAPRAARILAQGGVSPDPAQGGALAFRWDPLLRGHSPLPLTEPVLQALLPHVQAPVLLLRAEGGYVADEELARARLGGVRRLRVATLAGVSHHLHLEEPEATSALIAAEWRALGSSPDAAQTDGAAHSRGGAQS